MLRSALRLAIDETSRGKRIHTADFLGAACCASWRGAFGPTRSGPVPGLTPPRLRPTPGSTAPTSEPYLPVARSALAMCTRDPCRVACQRSRRIRCPLVGRWSWIAVSSVAFTAPFVEHVGLGSLQTRPEDSSAGSPADGRRRGAGHVVGVTRRVPETREQRCWVRVTANVLNALPKSAQPGRVRRWRRFATPRTGPTRRRR